jgi:hypothetical protein
LFWQQLDREMDEARVFRTGMTFDGKPYRLSTDVPNCWFAFEEIKEAKTPEPTPKFKPGDRVLCTNAEYIVEKAVPDRSVGWFYEMKGFPFSVFPESMLRPAETDSRVRPLQTSSGWQVEVNENNYANFFGPDAEKLARRFAANTG